MPVQRRTRIRGRDPFLLTPEQTAFIRIWLTNGNRHGPAYRKAFKRPQINDTSASQQGARLLKLPQVAAAIKAAREEAHLAATAVLNVVAIEHESRYAITKANILEKLSHLAFSDIRALLEWDDKGVRVIPSKDLTDAQAFSVIEVTERTTKQGTTIRFRLADKRAAIVDLAKVAGLLSEAIPDKKAEGPEVVEARKQARNRFLSLLEKLATPDPLTIEHAQALEIAVEKPTAAVSRK